ncbi:hypothetical protein G7076_10700 [Sphingomonas sp. HDW15A]|uniref:hypothetical protein n=1 Tax=Sphingomonas sp. HDW15A TaxID=2714942 RepID=UPI00140767A7|nr:hypothetical protein [Sphingomonas sp. HDW15A]QIK96833.1 hypothetical protein G7076_10700 [Sphingomonas sp. HDW15A]
MVKFVLLACSAGTLLAAPLRAQPASVASPDEPPLAAPVAIDPCTMVNPDEITVCAVRNQKDRYRIDPGVLGADRAANANPRPEQKLAPKEACPPHGPICSGQGAVPISAIAIAAAKTALLAANGGDWREGLGLTDDEDYEAYRLAKAKEERRRRERKVRVGIGVSGN